MLWYVAVLPFLPAWAGFRVPLLYDFTIARYLGSAVLGAALLEMLTRKQYRMFDNPLDWMIVVYLFNLVLLIQTIQLGGTLTGAVRYGILLAISYFLPAYLVGRYARNPVWAAKFLQVVVISAVLLIALPGLLEFLTGINPFRLLPLPILGGGDWQGGEGIFAAKRHGFWRVVGPFGKQIDSGWYHGLILLLLLGAIPYLGYRSRPFLSGFMLLLLSVGLFASVSGSPFLGTLLGLVVFSLLCFRQAISKPVLISAMSVLILVTALPQAQNIRDVVGAFLQFNTPAYAEAGIGINSASRLDVYRLLVPKVLESPFFGYGNFVSEGFTLIVRDVTSRYIVEALNGGLFGLMTFLLPLMWAGICALNARHNSSDHNMKTLAAGVLAGLVQCAAVYGTKNEGQIVGTYYWMLIGFACALPYQVSAQLLKKR